MYPDTFMGTLSSLVSLWIAHQSSVEGCCTSICLITWWSLFLFSRIICHHRAVRSISCRVFFLATRTCWSRRPSLSNQRYLQNVYNNYVLVDDLLEIQKNLYNILFIQKLLWNFVCFALLTTIYVGDEVIGAPIYPYWI